MKSEKFEHPPLKFIRALVSIHNERGLIEDAPLFGRFHNQFSKIKHKCFCSTMVCRRNYAATNDNSILKFVFTLHF